MLSSYRKYSLLSVLMFFALLHPIVFGQRCSGTSGCARTSSTAASVSGVAALSGQYAFQLNGTLTTPGIASRATAAIGSFYADGQGYIVSGEMDFTSAAQTIHAPASYPLNMVAYIVDDMHILVMSTDPPQVNPLISGMMTRDSVSGQ